MKKFLYTTILSLSLIVNTKAQTLLGENFSYSAGDTLAKFVTTNGWTSFSGGTTNAPLINSFGLIFTGHVGSGVGNSISLTTTGQDVYKQFNQVDTTAGFPNVFVSALVRVDTAQATGDYFMCLLPTNSTSNFTARTFARRSSANHYRVGINKSNETVIYSTDSFEYGTTYLYVIKYMFNSMGNNNDSIWLFVLNNVPGNEPLTPTVRAVGTQTDPANIARVVLRQGTASNAPRLTVDAIRVGTSWLTSPLPVEFTAFKATQTASGNLLTWSTAMESNNRGFEVQRSTNDGAFETIAFVNGAGNSNQNKTYTYVDQSANKATSNCYRLKQVDFDGKFDFSNKVCVASHKLNSTQITTQPNPFNNTLNIAIASGIEGTAWIEVLDVVGKVVLVKNATIQSGNNTVSFDTEGLKNGIYFVRVKHQNEVTTKRVIKN